MEVKKSQHKYIIGPKGNTLQEILEATGVSVEIPPLDSNSETIILRGEPDKLGPALTQVYAKVRGVHETLDFDAFISVPFSSSRSRLLLKASPLSSCVHNNLVDVAKQPTKGKIKCTENTREPPFINVQRPA